MFRNFTLNDYLAWNLYVLFHRLSKVARSPDVEFGGILDYDCNHLDVGAQTYIGLLGYRCPGPLTRQHYHICQSYARIGAGDSCNAIVTKYRISRENFLKANAGVSSCKLLARPVVCLSQNSWVILLNAWLIEEDGHFIWGSEPTQGVLLASHLSPEFSTILIAYNITITKFKGCLKLWPEPWNIRWFAQLKLLSPMNMWLCSRL